MPETAGSSITDLLINQPVLVWSLAGGLGILVIAGLLSVFLALRSRFRKAQAAKQALKEQRKNEAKENTAVPAAASKKASNAERKSAAENNDTAVANEPIADDQKGFLLIGASDESLELDDEELDELPELEAEAEEETAEAAPQDESGLAALFSADVIIDPYVQALRDHLQEITIDELLTNVRSVSRELQEHINASANN